MTPADFMTEVGAVLAERRQSYGHPNFSLDLIARRWSLTLGTTVTPAQVAMCMIDLKLARLMRDPGHSDSIVDIAGYAAILAEVSGEGG
jgi:hypothetical protein